MKFMNLGFIRKHALLLLAIALIGVTTLFSSCAKDGATGPAGSANVIYSNWFTPPSYIKDTVFGIWGFSYTKSAPDITQSVLDSGTLLTFGKLNGYTPVIWPTNQVAQLPISITYLSGSNVYIDTWSALAVAGSLKIRLVDNLNTYTGISNAHQFRYIIIPGAVHASRPELGAPGYSQMTYEQLCSYFNIPQ